MAGDALYASTALVFTGLGTNGSTAFTDSSATPKVPSGFGNAVLSNTHPLFGGTTIRFDGTDDYIGIPSSSADFNLGTGDFCLDGWYYPVSAVANNRVYQSRNGDLAAGLYLSHQDAANLQFYCSTDGTSFVGSGIVIPVTQNAWNYFQINRVSGLCKAYVGSAQVGVNYSVTGSLFYQSSDVAVVGGQNTPSRTINGSIADLRLTKGSARAVAMPVSRVPTGLGSVSGTVRDSTGALCARTVRLLRRDTGVVLGSAISDSATGAFSIFTPTLDEVVRIVHSGATTAPLENDLIDRVIPA